jgi:glycosyltransferase involved in cell wall biosynthesis
MPVYNPDNSFQSTIRSVLNQTYKNFELIVVDDGSNVDVTSVIEQLKLLLCF